MKLTSGKLYKVKRPFSPFGPMKDINSCESAIDDIFNEDYTVSFNIGDIVLFLVGFKTKSSAVNNLIFLFRKDIAHDYFFEHQIKEYFEPL